MKIKSIAPAFVISGAVALVAGPPGYAQSADGWDGSFPKRFYVGFGGGNARIEPDTGGTVFTVTDNTDKAGLVFVGMDFSRRLSLNCSLPIWVWPLCKTAIHRKMSVSNILKHR